MMLLLAFLFFFSVKSDCPINVILPDSMPVTQNQVFYENVQNPCGNCCGSPNNLLYQPLSYSLSPGAGGAPSPYGEGSFVPTLQNTRKYRTRVNPITGKEEPMCSNTLLSPLIFQQSAQYMADYLRSWYWTIVWPFFNWFYNPDTWFGETPCAQFKLFYSGIDVTVFRPDSAEPVCTTTADWKDYSVFQMANANAGVCIREENFMETKRKVAYAVNIVSACNQMRTVVLSKAKDEFPPGYVCQLTSNPCNPYNCQ